MKASKGDTVYQALSYNLLNVFAIRKLEVYTWGEKQATFIDGITRELAGGKFQLDNGELKNFFASWEEAESFIRKAHEEPLAEKVAELRKRVATLPEHKTRSTKRLLEDYDERGFVLMSYHEAFNDNIARRRAGK